MVQKLSSMGCQDVLQTRQVNFVPKKSNSGRGRPCLRADDVVLSTAQVIVLYYHLEIYLLFSRRNEHNEKNKHG